ncbi:MAG TPA: MraY family glycosyltransferase [bacterium]|nr:MraY family glycosyltransferase [bacterium]
MQHHFVALLIVAWMTSLLTTPLMRIVGARIGLLDHPHERKIQRTAIPRTGGIGILFGMAAAMIYLGRIAPPLGIAMSRELGAVLAGGALIHILGILDDLLQLSARVKFGLQVLVIACVVSNGVLLDGLTLPGGSVLELGIFAIPVTAFFLLGFINSFNLVDGLDGLAAGIASISAVVLALAGVLQGNFLLAALSLALLGAVVGFLPFNFIFGKTFLGDAGSMLLGYFLAVSALVGARFTHDATPVLLAIAGAIVPILDTFTTILRRLRNGQALFRPDSMHIHHRLIRFGLTPERTVVVILGVTAFTAGLALCTSIEGFSLLLVPTVLAAFLVASGMRRDRRTIEEDTEASIRETVLYLLGTLDGTNARLDGKQRIREVLATSPARTTAHNRSHESQPSEEKLASHSRGSHDSD